MASGEGLSGVLIGVWHHFGAPVVAAIGTLPVAVLLVWALATRRKRRGMNAGRAVRFSVAEVGIVIGTVPWVWMILTPDPGHQRGRNLVPFRDLANQIHVGYAFAAVQIGGNLLVFAALGFFLPIRLRVRPWHVLAVGVVASSSVETLQWVLRLGRFSSVDDVIVNAAGAFIAAWLSRPWWRRAEVTESVVGEDERWHAQLTWSGYDSAAYRHRGSARPDPETVTDVGDRGDSGPAV